jgi:hypothetical protein
MRNLRSSLIVLCLIYAGNVTAQITITNNFDPAPGTILRSQNDSFVDSTYFSSITSGSGGPMTWDFTQRTYGGVFTTMVVSTSSTPEIDSFPGANLVLLTAVGLDTTWLIHLSNSGEFVREGVVTHSPSENLITVYRDVTPEWIFPVALNNQWIAFRHWTQYNQSTHTDIFDSTYCTVNAWGSATYRTRSVSCLRVMSDERFTYYTYNDSNALIFTSYADFNSANFVGQGFNNLVTVTKVTQSFGSNYNGSASSEFLNGANDIAENGDLPNNFSISQNYPNPFNPVTTIQYMLPISSDVTLEIFDILGRKVDALVDSRQQPGNHQITWNAADKPSGIYFYKISAGDFTETKRMVLLK